jgi:adenylate kinase family enzyme
VLVIGCGGAGKSTFSRALAARTGLPLVHLDHVYWQPGWVPTPPEEWEARVRELIAGERWLIDGNYGGTMVLRLEAADTAIFLDVPRRTCLRRVYTRALRGYGRPRDDLGPGCPEKLPDLEFLRFVWGYRAARRPEVFDRLETFARRGGRAVILHTHADTRAFLETVGEPGWRPGAVSIGEE